MNIPSPLNLLLIFSLSPGLSLSYLIPPLPYISFIIPPFSYSFLISPLPHILPHPSSPFYHSSSLIPSLFYILPLSSTLLSPISSLSLNLSSSLLSFYKISSFHPAILLFFYFLPPLFSLLLLYCPAFSLLNLLSSSLVPPASLNSDFSPTLPSPCLLTSLLPL